MADTQRAGAGQGNEHRNAAQNADLALEGATFMKEAKSTRKKATVEL